MHHPLDTNAKALRLNLDASAYGAFAEIGAGQDVSDWFFRVGGAAGTVAKTISAYDMTVSDAIYGSAGRYVSRERLRAMLDHEYELLLQRLGATRGSTTAFFAFANTVATRSFKGGNESHGWIGLRFQHEPGAPHSDILLHAALHDPTALQQQQALGVLGVNLIFGAYYLRSPFHSLLKSLFDGLSLANMEIDVVECSGPAFEELPSQRSVAREMLAQGLTRTVLFDEEARMEQPSTLLRKRAILVHRCSMTRDNPELDRMLREAAALFASEGIACDREPLRLLELSIADGVAPSPVTSRDRRASIDRVFRPGHASMLTNFTETFRVSAYLHRHASSQIRFVLGLDSVVTILRDAFYKEIEGGLLEGLGRMLTPNTKLYAFPMAAATLRSRLELHQVEPGFWSVPERAMLTADDLSLAPPAGHLLDFLKGADWLVSAPVVASHVRGA